MSPPDNGTIAASRLSPWNPTLALLPSWLKIQADELDSANRAVHAGLITSLIHGKIGSSSESLALNHADINEIQEMLLRIVVATLLGAILGIDRDLHRKPAGVRVMSLVSMGSAAITMVAVITTVGNSKMPADPDGVFKTIQGVLSGIGFLGAGVIMRAQGKDEVHGLTTAASVWFSAILGMISGLGQWQLAISSFLCGLAILTFGRWVELQILKFSVDPNSPPTNSINRPKEHS